MSYKAIRWVGIICATSCVWVVLSGTNALADAELRIPVPKRNKATPVQKLNREGVEAVKKHHYDKAKDYFYHAYLLDPDDPFTLNNLGYISELEGDVDRAQRYYELAEKNSSNAIVAASNVPSDKGQSFADVVHGVKDANFKPNRANVEAIRLLSHGRPQEAEVLLQQSLALDSKNPFTLNNLGYAKESEGELKDALKYYRQSAALNSKDPVVVTVNPSWRGHAISNIAARNAKAVEQQLERRETTAQQVARLNLRGVSALNRNDLANARRYFQQAYKLNPEDGFTLNNMGYMAELDGDRETADDFYARARKAQRADDKVTLSTQRELEGLKLEAVAGINDSKVEDKIEAMAEARRREGGPIQLMRRNGTPVAEPEIPQRPPGSEQPREAVPPASAPPQPEATPRAPSPYSPEPPSIPAPRMPEPQTQPQTQPSGQPPVLQPQGQTVPQTPATAPGTAPSQSVQPQPPQ